jgi:hypothetical protein
MIALFNQSGVRDRNINPAMLLQRQVEQSNDVYVLRDICPGEMKNVCDENF